ncbi:MAG: DUF2334 domain-containing protein [Candidatus Euphemobacter frigidus]|nr:DUF2334 domain-containing protein [Candidatus Euphemobacter frigidus]MDP8275617.1 DUF2334 domain-containing protein [Candidatus Euphemobacter frigidus]
MRKRLRKILLLLGLIAVLLAGWIGFNTYSVWRDYLSGPPVAFLENDDVALGLYPGDYRSAGVFTNDDLCAVTPVDSIERLRAVLKRSGVRGTFFVIPNHLGENPLRPRDPRVELLEKLRWDGHEIAQHGYAHYCEKNRGRGVNMGAEMLFLNVEEQIERLEKGREILTDLGFPPRGHRCPCFSGNARTFRALDRLNYLYGSDLHLPPTTLKTFLLPAQRRRLMYPYHPFGLKLLEITSQTDPTVHKDKAIKVFKRYHRRGGVFAFLTHLPQIAEEENLARLEEFLNYLKGEKTWLCTMAELSEWWLAREGVMVRTERDDDALIITCDNPSSYPLKEIGIIFKKSVPTIERYMVADEQGRVLKKGDIPDSRRILLDIP